MKRLLAIILTTLCLALCACDDYKSLSDVQTTDATEIESSYIELNMENYEYYLSIQKEITDSGRVIGGSYYWTCYTATISGAISGIYEDCILTYKYDKSDETYDLKLNAAGFATFDYSVVNGNDISYVRVSGKIYI